MSSIWYCIRRPFVAVPNFGCDWSEADEAGELVHRVDPTRGRVATAATNPMNSTPLAVNFDSHVTKQLVRVGLNYKFDRPARSTSRPPMQARYLYFDLRTVTTIPARITDNLLSVGVNYKFDGADIWTND